MLYGTTGNGIWRIPLDSVTWYNTITNENNQTLFENVGAASNIAFGGSSGRWYLVNNSRDEITEYLSTPVRKFINPWVIN